MKTDGVFSAVHPTMSRPFVSLHGEKKCHGGACEFPVTTSPWLFFFFFFFHEGINLAEGGERGPCLKLKSACDGIGSYSATTLEKG